jgi:hypothetical protein
LYLTILQLALSLGLLACIPVKSAESVALCLAVPPVLIYVITIFFAAQIGRFPISVYLDKNLRPLLATMIMAAAMWTLPQNSFPQIVYLCLEGVIAITTYGLALFIVSRDTFNEVVRFSSSLLPKRFSSRLTPL